MKEFKRLRPIKGTPEAGTHFIGGLIGAAGSIFGGSQAAKAAEEAAEMQAAVANRQMDIAERQYATQRADLAPYREAGQAGINRLAYLSGVAEEGGREGDVADELLAGFTEEDFRADPGYQFRLEEGEKAIDRAAAARGMWGSPATVKELTRFGQGQADQAYQGAFNRFQTEQGNRFNRLAAIAGIGQTSNQQALQSGQNLVANTGQALQYGGDAAASGILNAANARWGGITGGISSAIDQYNINRALQVAQPTGQAPAAVPSVYRSPSPTSSFGGGWAPAGMY